MNDIVLRMIWRWCSKSPRWGISQSYRNFEMFGGFPTISSQTQVVWGLDILQLQESVSHSEGPIPEWRSIRLYCARVKTWWVYESLLLMDWWPSHNIHVAHMVLSGGNYRYVYIYIIIMSNYVPSGFVWQLSGNKKNTVYSAIFPMTIW